jgi:hypothetical protein
MSVRLWCGGNAINMQPSHESRHSRRMPESMPEALHVKLIPDRFGLAPGPE